MTELRDNPILGDGLTASIRTAIQVGVAHWVAILLPWEGMEWLVTAPVAAVLCTVMHVLSERYPRLARIFNGYLSDGAARYIGR